MTETAYDTAKAPSLMQKLSLRFHNASPFQRAFVEGVAAGIAVFILLFVWMGIRSDRTAEKVQSLFPVEAVQILRPGIANQNALPEDAANILLGDNNAGQDAVAPVINHPAVTAISLPRAPIEGVFETKNGLVLPVTHTGVDDDMTPFNAYKRGFVAVQGRPMVSVVVIDFGISTSLSDTALQSLPADITFALSSYAQDAMGWSAKARGDGHEIWLSLPMQTKDVHDDAGQNSIAINASLQQNQDNLWTTLGSTVGYAGIVSQPGHAFTGNDIDVEPIFNQIYGRGLGFAESNPDVSGFGETLAKSSGAPYVRNNLWVGDDLQPDAIDRAFQNAERIATKDGQSVIFVKPYPAVLKKLSQWAAETEERGIQIAPLSALVQ